jgi:SAM-dependent methyltransferase
VDNRRESFGQNRKQVLVERLGRWAALRKVERRVGGLADKRVGDFGCGFEAALVRDYVGVVKHATLIDFQLADDLKTNPKITAFEAELPGAIGKIQDGSLDVVICISVLEHVWDHAEYLAECRRILAPDGLLYVHVPSWWGKVILEICAFRFGWSAEGIDDHKRYYGPRDLWPLLRAAGFLPHQITCRRQQLGCSTFAVCRV